MYIIYFEDLFFNYILYRTTKTFLFLKRDGYYYIPNKESITHNLNKISRLRFIFILIVLKIIY